MSNCKIILFCLFLHSVIYSSGQGEILSVRDLPAQTVKTGETTYVKIKFHVKEGFHIMSDNPGEENFLPTVIEFEAQPGLRTGKPVFPASRRIRLDELIAFNVFDSTFYVSVPVFLEKRTKQDPAAVKGFISYQPCDSKKCFFPKKTEFILYLKQDLHNE